MIPMKEKIIQIAEIHGHFQALTNTGRIFYRSRDNINVWVEEITPELKSSEEQEINWPEWANWMATDENGDIYFYDKEPSLSATCWKPSGISKLEVWKDPNSWRGSLIKRQKQPE